MSATPPRRFKLDGVNLALFLAAIATIGVVVNFFSQRPWLRARMDATKTRAYSLSESTRDLLEGLEGEWTVAVVAGEQTGDEAALKQTDEILARFARASRRVDTVRIDPADPDQIPAYEALLARLRATYGDRIAAHEAAIAGGQASAEAFALFAQRHLTALARLRGQLAGGDSRREPLGQILGSLQLALRQAEQVDLELEAAMAIDEASPLPAFETARSILAAVLAGWAEQLDQVARTFAEWRGDADLDLGLRQYLAENLESFRETAADMVRSADPLARLEPLEVAAVGRSLEAGGAAIVLGPGGARVIGADQLFPALNMRRRADGGISFDQRFRGEQVIAAAIRSLLVDHMPMVVFVHAGGESLLRNRQANIDLMGVRAVLEASRYDVREWIVSRGERPAPRRGQRAVWVIVPPPIPEGRAAVVSNSELALLEAVRRLLADGEPVLINLTPSVLPRMGRQDPWIAIAADLGVDVDTTRVVYEQTHDAGGETVNQRVVQVVNFEPGHPVAAAAHGLRASFDLPVAMAIAEPPRASVATSVIAEIDPDPARWLEPDWMIDPARLTGPRPDGMLETARPLVVAVERLHPIEPGRRQRAVVVASGGWLLSYVADLVLSSGSERGVLLNPGNYELLQASLAWLAGADEMIGTSPVGRQVARLEGLTPAVQSTWRWLALAAMPLLCLLAGLGVWMARRQ